MITYNAAISACEKGQQPQQALQFLNQMQHRGLLPNVITYNATISACEKGQQPQQALQLLIQMQHRGLLPVATAAALARFRWFAGVPGWSWGGLSWAGLGLLLKGFGGDSGLSKTFLEACNEKTRASCVF